MDDTLALQALQSFNNSLTNNANVVMAAQTKRDDRNFSREMSEWQWQHNLQAWNMQNEYNLPSNQYARQLEGLRVNGLNPNLVYGSGSSVTGAASTPAPYRFEGYHSTVVPQFRGDTGIQGILSTRLLQTQVAAQEAQNRLLNARADNEEARTPGITAKSNEASYRWNYIKSDILDSYDAAIRAQVSLEYWKGVQGEYTASLIRDKSNVQYYEASIAEWLNTTKVPGTDMTYRQYAEHYKSYLSKEQFNYLKEQTANLISMIAYREKQGEYLDLKKEYQVYVNKFARLGRTLGNDWLNTLFAGLYTIFEDMRDNGVVRERPKSAQDRGASEPGDW